MRTVYLLWEWTFGDRLLGVFATEELAITQRQTLIDSDTYAFDRLYIQEASVVDDLSDFEELEAR